MTSWKVSKQGQFGEYISCTSPRPGDWVSYYDHLIFEGVIGSIIRAKHGTAEGNAKKVKGGYQIRAIGKCEDVKIVIKMLEDYFEPVELNNVFSLPDLPNWVKRLKYLICWITTGQK
jgi:hypothetical protein